jgi:hypothetical protein
VLREQLGDRRPRLTDDQRRQSLGGMLNLCLWRNQSVEESTSCRALRNIVSGRPRPTSTFGPAPLSRR